MIEVPFIINSRPLQNIVRAFNIFTQPPIAQPGNNLTGKIKDTQPDPSQFDLSPLGTPVMQNIIFKSVTYTDFILKQKRTTPDLVLINFLLHVNQAKKIVETEIQGLDGTVKEYIGLGDYNVTINGLIVAANGQSIASDLYNLMTQLKARVAIPVECDYLNNLGISTLVVKEFDLEQEAGGYSKQAFTIQCLSDKDVVLQIT